MRTYTFIEVKESEITDKHAELNGIVGINKPYLVAHKKTNIYFFCGNTELLGEKLDELDIPYNMRIKDENNFFYQ
jgi:hypothetical protein